MARTAPAFLKLLTCQQGREQRFLSTTLLEAAFSSHPATAAAQSCTSAPISPEQGSPRACQVPKVLQPLRGSGLCSSRGGSGSLSLCRRPLAFPKLNHHWLPLQSVPIHQEHRILGRLNICKETAEWFSTCTATQHSAGDPSPTNPACCSPPAHRKEHDPR